MDKEPGKLRKFNVVLGRELANYGTSKPQCNSCIQLKEMIEKQNKLISEMMADQKILNENISKLQATTENQNKVIVEMMADHKIQLQGLNKTRQNITAITTGFPLKNENEIQQLEIQINENNEEKYVILIVRHAMDARKDASFSPQRCHRKVSAIKYLIDGNAAKNLERIFSRELCMEYNTDGTFGKKSLKHNKGLFKVVLAAISHNSLNAEKELRHALQAVKKRHFRLVCSQKKRGVLQQVKQQLEQQQQQEQQQPDAMLFM